VDLSSGRQQELNAREDIILADPSGGRSTRTALVSISSDTRRRRHKGFYVLSGDPHKPTGEQPSAKAVSRSAAVLFLTADCCIQEATAGFAPPLRCGALAARSGFQHPRSIGDQETARVKRPPEQAGLGASKSDIRRIRLGRKGGGYTGGGSVGEGAGPWSLPPGHSNVRPGPE